MLDESSFWASIDDATTFFLIIFNIKIENDVWLDKSLEKKNVKKIWKKKRFPRKEETQSKSNLGGWQSRMNRENLHSEPTEG